MIYSKIKNKTKLITSPMLIAMLTLSLSAPAFADTQPTPASDKTNTTNTTTINTNDDKNTTVNTDNKKDATDSVKEKKISVPNYKEVALKANNKKNVSVYSGTKIKLLPSYPEKLRKKKFIYRSSNPEVATVSRRGLVKTNKKGRANITLILRGRKNRVPYKAKFKCKVIIKQSVTSINVPKTEAHYYVGKKYNLKANVFPAFHQEKILWKTSDKSKISVKRKTGVIKVKAPGDVTITAYSTKTNKEFNLQLKAEEVPDVKFDEGKTVTIDQFTGIQLHLRFINLPTQGVTYKSMDSSIATVTNTGYVKSNRCGEAYITATTADKKKIVPIKVVCKNSTGFLSTAAIANFEGIDECTNLMIVAHPDDEALWGGAHLKEGKWFILCLTNQYTLRKTEYRQMLEKANAKGAILDYPDIFYETTGKWKISNWNSVREGVYKDVKTIIGYKKWDQIITHSPSGETGHTQHKVTNAEVTKACKELNTFNNLWYFGTFYRVGCIPADLPKLTPEEIEFKEALVNTYWHEMASIDKYWRQMIPYENWVMAKDYK